MKIAAILGTARPGNYTGKALAVVVDEARAQEGVEVEFIDPAAMTLPWPGTGATDADVKQMRTIVSQADGIILATPEYHGGFSAVLKFLIEQLGFPSALAGRPIALVGVASGAIGAVKSLEQLRSVCSHVGALVLPGPVSVARVRDVFDAAGGCTDAKVEKRLRGVAAALTDYVGKTVCPARTLEAMVRE